MRPAPRRRRGELGEHEWKVHRFLQGDSSMDERSTEVSAGALGMLAPRRSKRRRRLADTSSLPAVLAPRCCSPLASVRREAVPRNDPESQSWSDERERDARADRKHTRALLKRMPVSRWSSRTRLVPLWRVLKSTSIPLQMTEFEALLGVARSRGSRSRRPS